MSRLEMICSKFLGRYVLFNDLHHDMFFFLLLILVFVSRMLVRALWPGCPVWAARVFTFFLVAPTSLGFSFHEVAHAAGHEQHPNAGAAGSGASTPSSSFKENSTSIDRLLSVLGEETSVSTGEPSVNQLERDSYREQQHMCLSVIRAEMLKQYKKDVGKRHFLMHISFYVLKVFNRGRMECDIDSICDDLEIENYSLAELEQFLRDIKEDKEKLRYFFQMKWP